MAIKTWSQCLRLVCMLVLIGFTGVVLGCFEGVEDDEGTSNQNGTVVVGGDQDSHAPRALTAGEDSIFFTEKLSGDSSDGGAISRFDLSSRTTAALVEHTSLTPKDIASNGNVVAWIEVDDNDTGSVCYIRADGDSSTTPVTAVEGLNDPAGLVLTESHIFFAEKGSETIKAIGLGNGDNVDSTPLVVASGVGAISVLALDVDNYLYFAQAWDRPNGVIRRISLDGFPHTVHGVEDVAIGLGTPMEIALTDTKVCWRELMGGTLQCKTKGAGITDIPTVLVTGQGWLPLNSPMLAASGDYLYYGTNNSIRRIAINGMVGQDMPVVQTEASYSFVHSFLFVGTELYWTDGSALRAFDPSALPAWGDGNGGHTTPGPGCPSMYDGTYFGQFTYEWESGSPDDENRQVITDSVAVNITFECVATAAGSTVLFVTKVVADDPFFGCQMDGCTPLMGSVGTFPEEAPTSPSNVSQNGHGIAILFPNGTSLATTNSAGSLSVSMDGRTLSNSLAPEIINQTWVAGSGFPPAQQDGTPLTKFKSWSLSKSAL